MPLDLLKFVFAAGVRVVDGCQLAKQCETEVVRIAVRTQNVLGTLKSASQHFENNVELRASLLELKELFETINSLIERCKKPLTMKKKANLVWQRTNPTREALVQAETRLEQITMDLGLPMLSDIKHQLNRMQEDAQKAVTAVADAAKLDTKAIAEVIRAEIHLAMKAQGAGAGGASIRDIITAEIAYLRSDHKTEADGSAPGDDAKTRGTSWSAASASYGAGEGTTTKDHNRREHPRVVETSGRDKAEAEQTSSSAVTLPGSPSPSGIEGGLVVTLGRVRFEDLEEGEVLGEGTFGTVVAARYRGRNVAVKKARGAVGSSAIMDAFRQEAEIHYSMRHPNIVEVIAFGLGDDVRPPCMVMERMHETLYDLLGVEGMGMPTLAAVSMVRDICEGLMFLHLHRIVHRDLKSLNVLLDESYVAKISDFGLAKVNSTLAASTGGNGYHSKVGSDFWMAPEVHSHHKATRASDVFSLHVVMWEAFTRQRAGVGMPIGERLLRNPDAHLPLGDMDCPDLVRSHIRSIFERCGAADQSQRPTMQEVCPEMERILKALQSPEENPLPPVPDKPRPSTSLTTHFGGGGGSTRASSERGRGVMSQAGKTPPPLPPRRSTASARSALRTRKAELKKPDRCSLQVFLQKCSPGAAGSLTDWKVSAGWGTPADLSRWYGVRAFFEDSPGGRERVVELNLPENNVCGTLPEELCELDCLTMLHLPNNSLTGVVPPAFGQLHSLESLDISGNKLTGAIPREFAGMSSVKNLSMHHNGLYGDIPDSIGDLRLLESLDLSDCDLGGPIPKTLGRLRVLRVLRLRCNRFSGDIPAELVKLAELEELNLGGNKLTGHILAEAGMFMRLKILDLSDNLLEGAIPIEVCQMECLRILHLYRNFGLSGGIPAALGNMGTLEEIDLSATQLRGEIPRELGQLSMLSTLTLGSCGLTGEIPVELGRLTSLKHLGLFGNSLTGLIPYELLQLPQIRTFNLANNRLQVVKARIGGTAGEIKKILPNGCNVRL